MDEKEIEQYIENNIEKINQKISDFKDTEPNDTEIKNSRILEFIYEVFCLRATRQFLGCCLTTF